jgi:NAD+ synthase
MEYYYADLLEYAVVGTANRLKYDQGMFVKNGDGAVDLEPIAHLYGSQVYQLARYLRVPTEIRRRSRSADLCPLEQSADDLYLLLPEEEMDLCLYGENNGIAASDIAPAVGLKTDQVQQVYQAIQAKRAAAEYLRAAPVLLPESVEA